MSLLGIAVDTEIDERDANSGFRVIHARGLALHHFTILRVIARPPIVIVVRRAEEIANFSAAQTGHCDERFSVADLDFAYLRTIRKQLPSLANRRPSAYRERVAAGIGD